MCSLTPTLIKSSTHEKVPLICIRGIRSDQRDWKRSILLGPGLGKQSALAQQTSNPTYCQVIRVRQRASCQCVIMSRLSVLVRTRALKLRHGCGGSSGSGQLIIAHVNLSSRPWCPSCERGREAYVTWLMKCSPGVGEAP